MRTALLATIILITLARCTKNDLPTANGNQLQKAINSWGDSISYTIFNYDQQDRLIEIIDSSNNNRNYNPKIATLGYDSHGKLANYLFKVAMGTPVSASFVYDGNGRVIKKITDQAGVPKFTNIYAYDTKGRLIADTLMDHDLIRGYSLFQYDKNDNVIEWHSIISKSSTFTIEHHFTYYFAYDNKPNSYSSIGKNIYFVRGGRPELLSKNNLLQIKWSGAQIDYTYEYYNSGLPKNICSTHPDPRVTPSCTEFFFD